MERLWLKSYPSNIPADLPPLDKSLAQLFESACAEFKNQSAFVSFGQSLSYKELKRLSLALAGYLQSQGLKKGEAFAIQLPNVLLYPVSLWAGILSGLTIVNISPLCPAEEMLGPLQETKAKGMILLSSHLPRLKSLAGKTSLKTVILASPGELLRFPQRTAINFAFQLKVWLANLFDKSLFKGLARKAFARLKALWRGGEAIGEKSHFPQKAIPLLKALQLGSKTKGKIQERDLKDTLFIQYTGGTTGCPKGVCLSHKNILSNIRQCELWMAGALKRGEERALAALPLCHIFALLVNGLAFFLNGFSNLLIANPRQISRLIKELKKYPPTVGTGVNALFKALLAHPKFKKLDRSSWKFFISGGIALEPSVQKLWQSSANSYLVEGYGLTEASPIVSCGLLDRPSEGFAGLPLPSTDIRIVNDNGQELKAGEEGELEARGPQVMEKYYKQEGETKEVLSHEGWLKTGDLAKISPEGLIQITGRKKDMINISGLKVYPYELEKALLACEKVKEALVALSKNSQGQEMAKAFIVRKDKSLKEKELIAHCKKRLAPYKIPKRFEFVPEIPKNFMGKPLRRLFIKN